MKVLKVILIVIGAIAILYGALVVYAYIPSPSFEPAAYEPIRPLLANRGIPDLHP